MIMLSPCISTAYLGLLVPFRYTCGVALTSLVGTTKDDVTRQEELEQSQGYNHVSLILWHTTHNEDLTEGRTTVKGGGVCW